MVKPLSYNACIVQYCGYHPCSFYIALECALAQKRSSCQEYKCVANLIPYLMITDIAFET